MEKIGVIAILGDADLTGRTIMLEAAMAKLSQAGANVILIEGKQLEETLDNLNRAGFETTQEQLLQLFESLSIKMMNSKANFEELMIKEAKLLEKSIKSITEPSKSPIDAIAKKRRWER